jgi:hypothetical protein
VNATFLLANGSKYFVHIMRIKYDFLFSHDFPFFNICHVKKRGVITDLLASSRGKNAKKIKNHWFRADDKQSWLGTFI